MSEPSPDSRETLIDRDEIRSWADSTDAVPVRSKTESGSPIGFAFDDDPDDRIDWSRFFTSFENGQLALLVDGSDFAFVDRNRVADTDDHSPETEEARQSERERAKERHQEEVVDPKADRRADEAADQENVDGHRDEEPFQG
jgi:hypothetical protein